ncbi:MAG: hypothetical protein HC913_02975 [Microscillaceae bacterium]|nr:hypothetical protein [Microscillaceae bacterium]
MKKMISSALFCVVFILSIYTSSNTSAQVIEIDQNPEQHGRIYLDTTYGTVRVVGCFGSGGTCTGTVVVENKK